MKKKSTVLFVGLCLLLAALSVLFLCLWQKEKRENEPIAPTLAVEKILLGAEETAAKDEAAVWAHVDALSGGGAWEIKIVFHGMLDETAVKAFLGKFPHEALTLLYDEVMMTVYTFRVPAEKDVTEALIALSHEAVVKSLSFAPVGTFTEQ